jgi:nitroimidazol reductase NimA-like FMN-containing flavoprotein (pyridoxamine 5'-phosphate oxidase superfamily)
MIRIKKKINQGRKYCKIRATKEYMKMRRKDREVTDQKEIVSMLERCNTIRVGISDGEYPYVVPVSFGIDVSSDKPILYFHCAKQGYKVELLGEKRPVFVEADTFIKVQKTEHGITTRYESVMAKGICERVNDPDEVVKGLELLLKHYEQSDYPLDRCRGIQNLYVYKIELTEMTGKHNLPE